MRIEDGYLITETPEEAEMIFITQLPTDLIGGPFWSGPHWEPAPGTGEYHPLEGVHVRRRLRYCTPEVLKRAGIIPDMQSQEFSPF